MADELLTPFGAETRAIKRRFVDMGDGTFAELVATTTTDVNGDGGGPGGDVNVVEQGELTDRSGTIAAGGTSQQVAAANEERRYLLIQNVSSEDLWVNFGVAAVATQPSILLTALGGSIVFEGTFVPTQAVNVIGATTGQAFTSKEG